MQAKCCGVDNSSNYDDVADKWILLGGQNTTILYPLSCCKLNDGVKFPPKTTNDFTNFNGCKIGDKTAFNNMVRKTNNSFVSERPRGGSQNHFLRGPHLKFQNS